MRADQQKNLRTFLEVSFLFGLSSFVLYSSIQSFRIHPDKISFSATIVVSVTLAAQGLRNLWKAGRAIPVSKAEEQIDERNSSVLGCLGITIASLLMIYTLKGSSSITETPSLLFASVCLVALFLFVSYGFWKLTPTSGADLLEDYKWSHLFEPVIEQLEWLRAHPTEGPDHEDRHKILAYDREAMRSECRRVLDTLDLSQPDDKSTAAGIQAGLELVEGWCDEALKLKSS